MILVVIIWGILAIANAIGGFEIAIKTAVVISGIFIIAVILGDN